MCVSVYNEGDIQWYAHNFPENQSRLQVNLIVFLETLSLLLCWSIIEFKEAQRCMCHSATQGGGE